MPTSLSLSLSDFGLSRYETFEGSVCDSTTPSFVAIRDNVTRNEIHKKNRKNAKVVAGQCVPLGSEKESEKTMRRLADSASKQKMKNERVFPLMNKSSFDYNEDKSHISISDTTERKRNKFESTKPQMHQCASEDMANMFDHNNHCMVPGHFHKASTDDNEDTTQTEVNEDTIYTDDHEAKMCIIQLTMSGEIETMVTDGKTHGEIENISTNDLCQSSSTHKAKNRRHLMSRSQSCAETKVPDVTEIMHDTNLQSIGKSELKKGPANDDDNLQRERQHRVARTGSPTEDNSLANLKRRSLSNERISSTLGSSGNSRPSLGRSMSCDELKVNSNNSSRRSRATERGKLKKGHVNDDNNHHTINSTGLSEPSGSIQREKQHRVARNRSSTEDNVLAQQNGRSISNELVISTSGCSLSTRPSLDRTMSCDELNVNSNHSSRRQRAMERVTLKSSVSYRLRGRSRSSERSKPIVPKLDTTMPKLNDKRYVNFNSSSLSHATAPDASSRDCLNALFSSQGSAAKTSPQEQNGPTTSHKRSSGNKISFMKGRETSPNEKFTSSSLPKDAEKETLFDASSNASALSKTTKPSHLSYDVEEDRPLLSNCHTSRFPISTKSDIDCDENLRSSLRPSRCRHQNAKFHESSQTSRNLRTKERGMPSHESFRISRRSRSNERDSTLHQSFRSFRRSRSIEREDFHSSRLSQSTERDMHKCERSGSSRNAQNTDALIIACDTSKDLGANVHSLPSIPCL